MYIVLGLILLLSVTGLWPYALIVIGLLLVFLFGAVVIGMTLHDEEAYLYKKFGMDEKDIDTKRLTWVHDSNRPCRISEFYVVDK